MTDLEKDYTLSEVAKALSMSTRWLRDRIKADQLPHQKYGHKILFTAAQVEAIRARYAATPVEQSITTGRKRRAS
jgi:predicted DNA-binding protein YlxM (UPF0122 family)